MSSKAESAGRRFWKAAYSAALVLCGALTGLMQIGCTQQLTPHDVAERFWRAAISEHSAKIKRYVLAKDRASLDSESKLLPIADFSLGRIVIDGDASTIDTSVTLDSDQPVTINIDTRLRFEEDQWRVDYAATANEISRHGQLAGVIDQIATIGDALKEGIDKSVDELNRAMPTIERELRRLESEFKQKLPELRQELRNFSKQIDEALKQPKTPAPLTPDGEGGTIAL